MSGFSNHHVCAACYRALEPRRAPVRLVEAELLPCCRCGKPAADGIYYRAAADLFIHCSKQVHEDR